MRYLRCAITVMLVTGTVLSAQEWTGWRGPSRDGAVAAAMVPKPWPKSLDKSWQVEVGEGYSSPVVSRGRAFVHSRRDPDEIVTAIDIATGKVVWQKQYGAAFQKNQYATQMAKGPNSTPLVAGTSLYTLGATGVLSAWNTSDGALLWREDYSASVDTSKLFCGTSMSPMLDGGSLIVQVGSDVHGGRVIALDPATGKQRWVWKGLGPGLLFLTDGGTLIVTPRGSDTFVEERRYEIGASTTWAIPVLLADGMLVREATGVVRLAWN